MGSFESRSLTPNGGLDTEWVLSGTPNTAVRAPTSQADVLLGERRVGGGGCGALLTSGGLFGGGVTEAEWRANRCGGTLLSWLRTCWAGANWCNTSNGGGGWRSASGRGRSTARLRGVLDQAESSRVGRWGGSAVSTLGNGDNASLVARRHLDN